MAERSKPFPKLTRDRLRATDAIKRLEKIQAKLDDFWTEITPGQAQALKLDADIQRWKIDKCLPSLKQVEISGQLQTEITVRFNPE